MAAKSPQVRDPREKARRKSLCFLPSSLAHCHFSSVIFARTESPSMKTQLGSITQKENNHNSWAYFKTTSSTTYLLPSHFLHVEPAFLQPSSIPTFLCSSSNHGRRNIGRKNTNKVFTGKKIPENENYKTNNEPWWLQYVHGDNSWKFGPKEKDTPTHTIFMPHPNLLSKDMAPLTMGAFWHLHVSMGDEVASHVHPVGKNLCWCQRKDTTSLHFNSFTKHYIYVQLCVHAIYKQYIQYIWHVCNYSDINMQTDKTVKIQGSTKELITHYLGHESIVVRRSVHGVDLIWLLREEWVTQREGLSMGRERSRSSEERTCVDRGGGRWYGWHRYRGGNR